MSTAPWPSDDVLTLDKLVGALDDMVWSHLPEKVKAFRDVLAKADEVQLRASPWVEPGEVFALAGDVLRNKEWGFPPGPTLVLCHPDHADEAKEILRALAIEYTAPATPTEGDE